MANISTVITPANNSLDWAIINNRVYADNNIGTMFLNALFMSNVSANGYSAWPGSSFTKYPVGSRLPLLLRGVKSGDGSIVLRAADYAREALAPLVTEGIISNLLVATNWSAISGANVITFNLTCNVPGILTPQLFRYGLNPNGTGFAYSL